MPKYTKDKKNNKCILSPKNQNSQNIWEFTFEDVK